MFVNVKNRKSSVVVKLIVVVLLQFYLYLLHGFFGLLKIDEIIIIMNWRKH